ncbi:MAG: type I-E CRISPR-associated protein Cse1/CasA, partial [Chitinivibrionales bacterium]|nr:type I-E CRISPR-associated protein Cse1/CasA [Chitinivibrionales bacterium]
MNLINDKWIPAKRADGTMQEIAPWQIGYDENPVIDILAPRPDFRGALFQFLIGLVQTAFMPEDDDEWEERWHDIPKCEE